MSVGGRAGKRLRDDEDGLGGGIEAGWGVAGMIEAGPGISMTFFANKKPGDSKISGQRLLHCSYSSFPGAFISLTIIP